MNVTLQRNAYGRQIDSHLSEGEAVFSDEKLAMMFIRAPKIIDVNLESVEVLARCGEEVVCVREGNTVLATFHPELVESNALHRYFFDLVSD